MKAGFLFARARASSRAWVLWSGGVALICLLMLAAQLDYLRGWITGPSAFDPATSTPDHHAFTRVEGEVSQTGVGEQTVTKMFHLLPVLHEDTADFASMQVGGKALLVKLPLDFHGRVVEGRLVSIPSDVQKLVDQDASGYPFLLDGATSYRWTEDAFIASVVSLVALIALLVFVGSLPQLLRVRRHPAIRTLARFGDPAAVAARVEGELADSTQVGSWWVHPQWLVRTHPTLQIFPTAELVGVAWKVVPVGSRQVQHLVVWTTDAPTPSTSRAAGPQWAAMVMDRIRAVLPWAVVYEAAAFEAAWANDRASLIAAAVERRASMEPQPG
jgi:hypothetical protein